MRTSLLALSAVLASSVAGCGVVRVETGGAKSPPPTTTSSAASTEATPKPKTVKQRLFEEAMPCGFVLFPGIGKTTSSDHLDIARRVLGFYEKWHDGPPGTRLPADVTVIILRSQLYSVWDQPGLGAHAAETYQGALDFFAEALPRVKDLPADVIAKDPASRDFCPVAKASATLVVAVHGAQWQAIDGLVADVEKARDAYELKAGHESPRARALVDEAHAVQTAYAGAADAYRAAADALEKDKTRDRLIDQKNDAASKADTLRGLLGLTGYDDGCDKRSVDPVAQARLQKLCPLARREFALIKQIDQIERRYMDPVYKKFPSPEARTKGDARK